MLAHNPVLLARCFWYFARKHGDAGEGRAPPLPAFIIAAGMLFHADTIAKIHAMNFDSRLLKVVAERPDLLAGLQGRVEGAFRPTIKALQVGVSSDLLVREGGDGFPTFRAAGGGDLPFALRDTSGRGDMINAARRLGAWFADEPLAVIQRQLAIEF
jgi:hypothetical protein